MSVVLRRFGCPVCKAPFTSLLRELPTFLANGQDRCTQSAVGCWTRHEQDRRPDAPIAVMINETQNLTLHEDSQRSIGCCGYGFSDKLPNLRCAQCRSEVAYRESDGDHIWHAIYIPEHCIEEATIEAPDDQQLLSRLTAHRASQEELPAPLPWDTLLSELMPKPLLYYDPEDMPSVPLIKSFDVKLGLGGELRCMLNGLSVRPPWPLAERERVITLGRLPEGRPDDPVLWWLGEPTKNDEVVSAYWSHEWTCWRSADEVFVVWKWNRQRPQEPLLAFRIDAAYWSHIWETRTNET
jgi:hypothetical protein